MRFSLGRFPAWAIAQKDCIMRISLVGGSGQLGQHLGRELLGLGHTVTEVSRQSHAAPWTVVPWNGQTLGDWVFLAIENADVVINLAGRTVNCRYGPVEQAEILNSRVETTRLIGTAIASAKNPPAVWLNSSTATIYDHRLDGPQDESSGTIGQGNAAAPAKWKFSQQVALAWEEALNAANTPHTRKVALRTAMVMTLDRGGVFDVFRGLCRKGLGEPWEVVASSSHGFMATI
jgi:uncharacterized protein